MAFHDRNYGDLRLFKVSPSKKSLLSLAVVFVILESSYLIMESYWTPLRSNSRNQIWTTSNLQWSTSPTLKDIIKKNADEEHPNYRCINIFVPVNATNQDIGIYSSLLHSQVISRNPNNLPISRADILYEKYWESGDEFDVNARLIWIPHDDWLPKDPVHANISLILARTRRVLERLQDFRRRSKRDFTLVYTKQSRPDNYTRGSSKTYEEFLYVGAPEDDNISPILTAWSRNPGWPNLTILSKIQQHYTTFAKFKKEHRLDNVKFIHTFTQDDIVKYQNYISIHLLPRTIGGNISYDMNMARSTASLIIAGDAAPFNELINDESGVLIGKRRPGGVRYPNYDGELQITAEELERGVNKVLGMTLVERMVLGESSRQRFLADVRHFTTVMEALNSTICSGQKKHPFSFDLLTPYVH